MNEDTASGIERLKYLAEFRFQLRKFLSFSESATDRHGISAQQYQLMQAVGAMPLGQCASIGYLADRMILRHNSTVELVDRGVRAGLVRREVDIHDLRRSLVRLTPEGTRLLEALVAEHLHELERRGHEMMDALEHLHAAARSAGRTVGTAAGTVQA